MKTPSEKSTFKANSVSMAHKNNYFKSVPHRHLNRNFYCNLFFSQKKNSHLFSIVILNYLAVTVLIILFSFYPIAGT
jgi:hypothetical protein